MLKEIRWIMTDLDDTLLGKDGNISKRTLRCLEKCREQGLMIGFVTARPLVRSVELTLQFAPDLLIFGGGAGQMYKGWLCDLLPLEADTVKTVLELQREDRLIKHIIADGLGPRYTDSEALLGRIPHSVLWDFNTDLPPERLSFVAWLNGNSALNEMKKRLPNATVMPFAKPNMCRISDPQATKYAAITRFCRKEGIAPEQVIAFGDDMPDLEMLEKFTGVAMENACEEVKAAAKYITCANAEDGVAVFIEKHLLR
jgi:Predicted hydrolases of the HAD superfamily